MQANKVEMYGASKSSREEWKLIQIYLFDSLLKPPEWVTRTNNMLVRNINAWNVTVWTFASKSVDEKNFVTIMMPKYYSFWRERWHRSESDSRNLMYSDNHSGSCGIWIN